MRMGSRGGHILPNRAHFECSVRCRQRQSLHSLSRFEQLSIDQTFGHEVLSRAWDFYPWIDGVWSIFKRLNQKLRDKWASCRSPERVASEQRIGSDLAILFWSAKIAQNIEIVESGLDELIVVSPVAAIASRSTAWRLLSARSASRAVVIIVLHRSR